MTKWVQFPRAWVWVVAAYLPGLWLMGVPLTGDQKVYLGISKEMFEAGSWWTPLLFGEPNFLKPPFQYWATVLSWNIFGFNTFATVLPSVLFLALTTFCIDRISQRWGSNLRAGGSAALWFAGMAAAMTYGLSAQMEIYLVGFFALAWLMALQNRIFWAFAVVGVLGIVKSPLYCVFWTMGLAQFWIMRGEWWRFKSARSWLALGLGIAVASIWYLGAYALHPQEFWGQYVVQESLSKRGGNSAGLLEFWWNFWIGCFPAAFIFLAFVGRALIKKSARAQVSERTALLWSWGLLPALFFSYFPYRTETYLFPLAPLVAWCVESYDLKNNGFRWSAKITAIIIFVLVGVIAWVGFRQSLAPVSIIGVILILGGIAGWILGWGRQGLAPVSGLVMVLAIRVMTVSMGQAELSDLKSVGGTLAYWDTGRDWWNEVGLISSGTGREIQRLYQAEQVVQYLENKTSTQRALVLADHQVDRALVDLAQSGFDTARLQRSPWRRWKRRGGFNLRELALGSAKTEGDEKIPEEWSRTYWVYTLNSKNK